MACSGCPCSPPAAVVAGGTLLLSTTVSHTRSVLLGALRTSGAGVRERFPGLFEVRTPDSASLLRAVHHHLTLPEAAEVRAVVLLEEDEDAVLAAAMAAPTLGQLVARHDHVDLQGLLAAELESFRCVYQPIVRLDGDGGPVAYEALLRARSGTTELLPSALFTSAGRTGWLNVLDRIGRTTALRGAAGWLGELQLFVNFLPTTIYRPEVCLATTEQAAERAGLRLDQLVFEVSESEQVNDLDHLEKVFSHYRDRGCKVALDDLGAGYSSLNTLVRLRPDIVKLDKDIVQRLPEPSSRAVVTAVVDIAHSYGGTVLAECVETAEQAAVALELGVDLGQGWFFGRPEERSAPVPAARRATTAPLAV